MLKSFLSQHGRIRMLLLCCLAGSLLTTFVPRLAAQNNKPASTGVKGEILISNSAEGQYFNDAKNDISRITKGVRVTQRGEDFILYTDDLTYDRKNNRAVATGGVRVESRESTIRGARMQSNFTERVIIFEDNVRLTARGPNDGIQTGTAASKLRSELRQKPVEVLCNRVDYNYENRQAIAVGNVRIKQGDSHGTCDRIVYDEDRNIVRLLGNVSFTNAEGQTFRGQEVTVWVDDDKISGRGSTRVTGPPQEDDAETQRRPKIVIEDPFVLPGELLQQFRPHEPLSPVSPLDESTPPTAEDVPESGTEAAPVKEEKAASQTPAKTAAKN